MIKVRNFNMLMFVIMHFLYPRILRMKDVEEFVSRTVKYNLYKIFSTSIFLRALGSSY